MVGVCFVGTNRSSTVLKWKFMLVRSQNSFVLVPTRRKDICTTMSNGFKCIAMSKVSVGPCFNLAGRKSNEHTKIPSWFVNTKVYSLLHFLVVVERRETEHELSQPCWLDKEKQNFIGAERTDLM